MTRMDTLPEGEPVTVAPMKTFPIIRDLVTDVTFNYEVAKTVPAFARDPNPRAATACCRSTSSGARSSASASSASCARTSATSSATTRRTSPSTPGRVFIRFAELDMHPLDVLDRRGLVHDEGLGMCNITKCCTEVCPEHIEDHRATRSSP